MFTFMTVMTYGFDVSTKNILIGLLLDLSTCTMVTFGALLASAVILK